MSKNIIAVVLAVFMLLFVAFPASATIQATSVEIRGEVYDANATGHIPHTAGVEGWDAFNFAGFWYDLKNGLQSESLTLAGSNASLSNNSRTIIKQTLYYNATERFVQYKVNEANNTNNFVERGLTSAGTKVSGTTGGGYYAKIGWQAEPYAALDGDVTKLSKIIIEQGTSSNEKKTLTIGESWDIGDGWQLTAQSIDAKASPRQAWLVLSKDGNKKDDKVIAQGQVYTYVEKSIGGKSDVPLFVTYVDSVFAGATSDMVQLRYTFAVSTSVTEVKSGDKFGVMKVTDTSSNTLKLWNEDSSVDLSQDSTVDIMGSLQFVVADNDSLRFYPAVSYEITGPGGATATPIGGTSTGTVTGTSTAVGSATATLTTVPTEIATVAPTTSTTTTAPTATPKEPGFEAVFAVAGLLAVAFLVLRQRK